MRRVSPTIPSWLRAKNCAFGHGNYITAFGKSGTGNSTYDAPMETAYGVYYLDGSGGGTPLDGHDLDYFQTLLLVACV